MPENMAELRKISGRSHLLGIFLSLSFVVVLSWRKWPDILIDFGRELYVPWMLHEGKVLYKDIAHLFGPFSTYLHALLFEVFGVSYLVIIWSNLLWLAGFLILLCRLMGELTDRTTAFICSLAVVWIFAAGQYIDIGNYNFASPYSHEATHGIILSVLMFYSLWRFASDHRRRHLVGAGLLLGFVFLTKAEVFAAALIAAVFLLLLSADRKNIKSNISSLGIIGFCAFVPLSVFFLYFATKMPARDAFGVIFSPLLIMSKNQDLMNNAFYLSSMGRDNIELNLVVMILHTLLVLLVVALATSFSRNLFNGKITKTNRIVYVVLMLGIVCTAFFVQPLYLGFSLPVLCAISLAVLLRACSKEPEKNRKNKKIDPIRLLAAWSVFSLLLLLKILFKARVHHYGFYLALPSVILVIAMLLWFYPKHFINDVVTGKFLRKIFVAIFCIIMFKAFLTSFACWNHRTFPVGADKDRLLVFNERVDTRGPVVTETLNWINLNTRKQDTLVVVPEGVMLNYLSRRINPTRYTNFMVPEMAIFKEQDIINDLELGAPDYFVIVHKDTSEYGVGYFGKDPVYGVKTMNWIKQNYHPVALFGKEPLQDKNVGFKILEDKNFGIKILKRKRASFRDQ